MQLCEVKRMVQRDRGQSGVFSPLLFTGLLTSVGCSHQAAVTRRISGEPLQGGPGNGGASISLTLAAHRESLLGLA